MISRERLSLDEPAADRTCFLSHVGAQGKLVPGPWIGHRDLVYAMALANLSPAQRTSLARAVLVDHGREFGVGRLTLEAVSSGLPLGGSSLRLAHRQGGAPVPLYLGVGGGAHCGGVRLAAASGAGRVGAGRASASAAGQGAAHPGLVGGGDAGAGGYRGGGPCRSWPRVETRFVSRPILASRRTSRGSSPRRRCCFGPMTPSTAPACSDTRSPRWCWSARRSAYGSKSMRGEFGGGPAGERLQITEVGCPGRVDREHLRAFWESCARPRILLRGDSEWTAQGAQWLRSQGATVEVQGQATQLSLI